MMDDPEARYRAIIRRIAARKNNRPRSAAVTPEGVLDALNAFDALDDLRANQRRCHGPKVVRGRGWMGAVIWCQKPGYSTRPALALLGIWALGEEDISVIVGTKTLHYSAPVYTAEAYHRLIRAGFETYYDDDGGPPPETGRLFSARYDPAARLALREQIAAILARWAG